MVSQICLFASPASFDFIRLTQFFSLIPVDIVSTHGVSGELKQFRILFGNDDALRMLLTIVLSAREMHNVMEAQRDDVGFAAQRFHLREIVRASLPQRLSGIGLPQRLSGIGQAEKWPERFVDEMSKDALRAFRDSLEAPPSQIDGTDPNPNAPTPNSPLSGSSSSAPVRTRGHSRAAAAAANENPRYDPDYGAAESATFASEATASHGGNSTSVTDADDSR
jgi:hypothetical protein